MTVAFLLVFAAQVGGLAHLFNLVGDRTDKTVAAATVSLVAAASIGGRLTGGWLLGRMSLRTFGLVCTVQHGLGLPLLAEAFGVREFPGVYGLSQLVATVGIASGPVAIGALADRLGGYQAPIAAAAASSLGAAAVLALGTRR